MTILPMNGNSPLFCSDLLLPAAKEDSVCVLHYHFQFQQTFRRNSTTHTNAFGPKLQRERALFLYFTFPWYLGRKIKLKDDGELRVSPQEELNRMWPR